MQVAGAFCCKRLASKLKKGANYLKTEDINLYSPFVAAGTVTGVLHERANRPGADAFYYETTKSGTIVISVADGLGSATCGHIGSEITVKEAVFFLKSHLDRDAERKLPTPGTMKRTVRKARTSLERYASLKGHSIHDFATTLLVIAIEGGSVISAHIGDGAIVGSGDDEISFISRPEHGEYLNEIVPLTSKEWMNHLRINKPKNIFNAIALFTDGCEGASLERLDSKRNPLPGFFFPLFTYMKDNKDKRKVSRDITNFLNSEKMRSSSDDDKTLVLWVSE